MYQEHLILMTLAHAYRAFIDNPAIAIPEQFYDKKITIYNPIVFKKFNIIDWFHQLKNNGTKSVLFLYKNESISKITELKLEPIFGWPYLAVVSDNCMDVFSIGDHPFANINREQANAEFWIELKEQYTKKYEYVSPDINQLEKELKEELNLNLFYCEKHITENAYAEYGVDMYKKAINIINNKIIAVPDYILFPDILNENEKYLLSAIGKIDIVYAMSSFVEQFPKGMSKKLHSLIIVLYQVIINGNKS